jgi:hypothetical protein
MPTVHIDRALPLGFPFGVPAGGSIHSAIANTNGNTVLLQRSFDSASWETIATVNGAYDAAVTNTGESSAAYAWVCPSFSGQEFDIVISVTG